MVRQVQFCRNVWGCAFDEIMTDPHAVYVKMDDDIVFIKDGSIEHLVYQVVHSFAPTMDARTTCTPRHPVFSASAY